MILEGATFLLFHLILPPFILVITLTLGMQFISAKLNESLLLTLVFVS